MSSSLCTPILEGNAMYKQFQMLTLQRVIHTDDNEQVYDSKCCLNVFSHETYACILVRREYLNLFSPKTIASCDCHNVNGP